MMPEFMKPAPGLPPGPQGGTGDTGDTGDIVQIMLARLKTPLEFLMAEAMRARGRNVYTIPGGGSNPTGAMGYVNCVLEVMG